MPLQDIPRRVWLLLGLALGGGFIIGILMVVLHRPRPAPEDSLVLAAPEKTPSPSPSPSPKPARVSDIPIKIVDATRKDPPLEAAPKAIAISKGTALDDPPSSAGDAKGGVVVAFAKGRRPPLEVRAALHPGVDAKAVERAIGGGVAFLRREALRENLLGGKALAGLALLHCGVAPGDPLVQRLAAEVRENASRRVMPYDLAACIWFLDRLGAAGDAPLIRSLALRLIASQQEDGGWGYYCVPLAPIQESALLKLLGGPPKLELAGGRAPGPPPGGLLTLSGGLPPDLKRLPVLRYVPGKGLPGADPAWSMARTNRTDNSLTQFAVLALWTSQRHGVPAQRSLLLAAERFRASQAADGSWSYEPGAGGGGVFGAGPSPFRDTATCAGLLGLACGAGARLEKVEEEDPAVSTGMRFLSRRVEKYALLPIETRRRRVAGAGAAFQMFEQFGSMLDGPGLKLDKLDLGALLKAAEGIGKGGGGPGMPGAPGAYMGAEAWGDAYFLWSLERMAVAYDLKTIGARDWYAWGAPILVACQEVDGSWREAFAPVPDTCFALLFLRRANLFVDLTVSLDGMALAKEAGQRERQTSVATAQARAAGMGGVGAAWAIGPGD